MTRKKKIIPKPWNTKNTIKYKCSQCKASFTSIKKLMKHECDIK